MNPRLAQLHTYPFERLARLKADATPPSDLPHIAMSIGEPQHAPPAFVLETLRQNLGRLGSYPTTVGLAELRASAAKWLGRRFRLSSGSIDPDTMVLPVNGTREALFAFVQAVIDERKQPVVAMPNPFYQIYEGAALLAGASPYFIDTVASNGFVPDIDAVPAAIWQKCQILFLCSPGNPSGTVLSRDFLRRALTLAEQHDFVVAADECYTDIYLHEDSPPSSLLQAALDIGNDSLQRCMTFHSLSKRSSVPGMRSGFVAGDPHIISRFLLYRTYHGSAMPVPTQLASISAWDDEAHAAANRRLYLEKFDRVIPILSAALPIERPAGAFYLWVDVGEDDEVFTRDLFKLQNVTVLPGSYLARESGAPNHARDVSLSNPGAGRVRISLVPEVSKCVEAAGRIRDFVRGRR